MRKIIALLILVASMPVAKADTSACYSLTNPDARNYCLAKAKKDRSICYNIIKADLRSQCLAEVTR